MQLGQLLKARNNGVCRQESSEMQDGDTGFIPERMCERGEYESCGDGGGSDVERRQHCIELAYISLDPYYRGRMQEDKRGLYFPPFQLGKVNCTSYTTAKLRPRALTSRPSSHHIVLQTVQKIC